MRFSVKYNDDVPWTIYHSDFRPVPLIAAARLAGVSPSELWLVATAPELAGTVYALSVYPGPDGPLFDPWECEGIRYTLPDEGREDRSRFTLPDEGREDQ